MSRWIDADAFLEDNKEFADREFEHPMYQATLRELIDEAPSIDIVRCKECRYYKADDYSGVFHCFFSSNAVTGDDFCSYGEVSKIPTGSEKPNDSTISILEQVGKE